jgi:hypothetical protein
MGTSVDDFNPRLQIHTNNHSDAPLYCLVRTPTKKLFTGTIDRPSDLLSDTYASDPLEHAKDRAVARRQQRHPGNTCKVIDPPCHTFGWGTLEISLGQVIIDQMAQHELWQSVVVQ